MDATVDSDAIAGSDAAVDLGTDAAADLGMTGGSKATVRSDASGDSDTVADSDDVVDSAIPVNLKADIDSAALTTESTTIVDLIPTAGLNAAVNSGNDTDSATPAGSKAVAISDSPIGGNTAVNTDAAVVLDVAVHLKDTTDPPIALGAAASSKTAVDSDAAVDFR